MKFPIYMLRSINEQPYKTMEKSGFVQKVGKDNFRPHIDDALAWAAEIK